MKTKTFLILRVVQVPTGVKQVALPKWIALLKTLDFSFQAARFFFHLFWDPFLDGWTSGSQEPRTAQCSLRCLWVSSASEVAGRVLEVSSLLVLSVLSSVLVLDLLALLTSTSENNLPAKLFCSGSLLISVPGVGWQSAGVACIVLQVVDGSLLHVLVQFLLVLSTLPSENIFDGCAGRHGEEQRAPGGWRAPRSLPGGAWAGAESSSLCV